MAVLFIILRFMLHHPIFYPTPYQMTLKIQPGCALHEPSLHSFHSTCNCLLFSESRLVMNLMSLRCLLIKRQPSLSKTSGDVWNRLGLSGQDWISVSKSFVVVWPFPDVTGPRVLPTGRWYCRPTRNDIIWAGNFSAYNLYIDSVMHSFQLWP